VPEHFLATSIFKSFKPPLPYNSDDISIATSSLNMIQLNSTFATLLYLMQLERSFEESISLLLPNVAEKAYQNLVLEPPLF